MLAPIRKLDRLGITHRGFLPIPSLLILIYSFIWYFFQLQIMTCLPIQRSCEFVTFPQIWGLSPLDLFTIVNGLLGLYLIVSAWSLIRERGRQVLNKVFYGIVYVFSFALLFALQTHVNQISLHFELPDEILNLRMNEFHDLGRPLEDLVVPRLDDYDGYDVSRKRCVVTITRPGHYVRNRRDLGDIDNTIDTIVEDMRTRILRHGVFDDDGPDMTLLIRADMKTEFRYVHRILQLCRLEKINLSKIEFACIGDLQSMAPEAVKKLYFYQLPEGMIEYRLPDKDNEKRASKENEPSPLEIHIHFNRRLEGRYNIEIEGRTLEGPDSLNVLHVLLRKLLHKTPNRRIVICAHDRVEHGQFLKVYNVCRKLAIENITFEVIDSK